MDQCMDQSLQQLTWSSDMDLAHVIIIRAFWFWQDIDLRVITSIVAVVTSATADPVAAAAVYGFI